MPLWTEECAWSALCFSDLLLLLLLLRVQKQSTWLAQVVGLLHLQLTVSMLS